jgi:CBS domain-containing protein
MSGEVVTCREEETVEEALETMRRRELRRLPALDAAGRFAGLLALDDIVLGEQAGGENAAHRADFYAELETTVKAICSHRTPSVAPWG